MNRDANAFTTSSLVPIDICVGTSSTIGHIVQVHL